MGTRKSTAATAAATPEEDTPRHPGYGVPSPALLARARRGIARFLDGVTEPGDDTTAGHDDPARHP